MTRKSLLFISSVMLAVAAPALFPVSGVAAEVDCASFDTNLLQSVKPSTQANLLTRSALESEAAKTRFGFTDDRGVLAEVADSDEEGLTAIWRLYHAGDFVWAAEGRDVDRYVAGGYAKQFVNFYASSEDSGCLGAVYQLEKGAAHRIATADDRTDLLADGWTADGVAFYAKTTPAVDDPDTAPDTTFSIAVIPDTQQEVTSAADTRLKDRSTWLADNKDRLDLRYAVQVGDLVNWGNVDREQFTRASTGMKPLESAVPWSGAIGNHDTAAVCKGGSACPGAKASQTVRDTSAYNDSFPVSRFPRVQGTFEPDKIDNAWQTLNAGGLDWLVLNLELWPRTAVVNWAADVVQSHPHHNVIIATHAYLDGDGSISSSNGGYGSNSPQYVFDRVVKPHANVKLVLSGHVGDSASRVDKGANGNKVVSILQCIHSTATNPVRLLEINTAAGRMTSEVYAPKTDSTYPQWSTNVDGLTFVH